MKGKKGRKKRGLTQEQKMQVELERKQLLRKLKQEKLHADRAKNFSIRKAIENKVAVQLLESDKQEKELEKVLKAIQSN